MDDMALALLGTAVVVEWSDPGEAGGLAGFEGAELGDRGQEDPGGALGDALDLAEAGDLGGEFGVGALQRGDLGFKVGEMGGKGLGELSGLFCDEEVVVMFGAVGFLDDEAEQFLAAAHQVGEPLEGGGAWRGGRGQEKAAVLGEDDGIDGVGLGEDAFGAGQIADSAGVHEGDRNLGEVEGLEEGVLIAAGGLANELDGAWDAFEDRTEGSESLEKAR